MAVSRLGLNSDQLWHVLAGPRIPSDAAARLMSLLCLAFAAKPSWLTKLQFTHEGRSILRVQMIALATIVLGSFTAACTGQGGPGSPSPLAAAGMPQSHDGRVVHLAGPSYEVLRSGPTEGPRPLRSDDVSIRYVGRLADGSVFSTSANNGAGPSTFSVRSVIPGFSSLVQLMRPGDRWRFMLPAYLGYGHAGRRFTPPEETLKRDIPPESELIFDVELVSIMPSS